MGFFKGENAAVKCTRELALTESSPFHLMVAASKMFFSLCCYSTFPLFERWPLALS